MRRAAFIVAVAALVAGCDGAAPPTASRPVAVSLAEARQAAVERETLPPVPRSIADVTAILRQEHPDAASRVASRARADAEPPAGLGDEALGDFLLARAHAARDLGRLGQELADARKSVEAYRRAGIDSNRALQILAHAEQSAGNLRRAIEIRKERLAAFAGKPAALAEASHLAAIAMLSGNVDEAKRWAEEAARLHDALKARPARGRPAWVAFHRDYLNAVAQACHQTVTGRFADAAASLRLAERAERRAIELHDEERHGGDPISKSDLALAHAAAQRLLAFLYARQGRLVEAEAEARAALDEVLKTTGAASSEAIVAIRILASILIDEGRFADAETLSREGIRLAEAAGIEPGGLGSAQIRLQLSDALALQGQDREALEIFDTVAALARQDELTRRWALRDRSNTIPAMYRVGRAADGLAIAQTVERRRLAVFGPDAPMTAEASAFVAIGTAARGDRATALATLRRVVPILLKEQGLQGEEDGGSGATAGGRRLRFILESYVDLLADSGAADAAVEAFRAADAAHLQRVHRAIAASAARAAAGTPELAEMARQEQDLANRIAAGWTALATEASLPPEQRDEAATTALRTEIDRLTRARTTLREAIAERSPAYATLTQPKPAELAEARRRLGEDEAMVMILEGRRRSYVWAFRREGPVAFRTVPLAVDELRQDVARLRRPMETSIETLDDVQSFDTALAYRLYAALLQPVEAGWRSAETLVVVPDGELASLPFGLLLTKPAMRGAEHEGAGLFSGYRDLPWLIREAAIAQSPSAAAFVSLRSTRPAAADRQPFVGFGDPRFIADAGATAPEPAGTGMRGVRRRASPATETKLTARLGNLPPLPDTADEVREVAAALKADPATDIYLGAAATESRVLSMRLDDRRVVMFATHGLLPGDLDGLSEPALALSAPAQRSAADDDGLLTASNILRLKLNADWVVLSACNTGAPAGAGAEALSGLARAFFYAGSRAVLATNWPVETTSARALTVGLFRAQAEHPDESRARALRAAALAVLEGGRTDPGSGRLLFSYAHPLFWAPYTLVGDGGR